jgi:hypothetical protein
MTAVVSVPPRNGGVRSMTRVPATIVAHRLVAACWPWCGGMRSMSVAGTAASAMPAVTQTAASGEAAAAIEPATAGPAMAAPLNVMASMVLARGSTAGGTRLGTRLVKPALVSGSVAPAAAAISRHHPSGTRPSVKTSAAIEAARMSWLAVSASLRWWVRSSHAPRTGPDTSAGNVYALTIRPAAAGLSVRCRASSTTATPTQPSATRMSPAARVYQTRADGVFTAPCRD